jgi:hypothetical protein
MIIELYQTEIAAAEKCSQEMSLSKWSSKFASFLVFSVRIEYIV